MNVFSITIEIILASLLLIAIMYCWKLDQSLKSLRSGRDRLLESARELQASVIHAENAIGALRKSADHAGRDLQAKIDEARAVAEAAPRQQSAAVSDLTLRRRSVL